ncbi:MAG: hypothetical protein M0R66_04350 [Candidatus Omnitrophica bacterium]|jgi:hypothetical protein|nr:hypothetical protein [Candidatus Omnitrophota bacterium]
MAIARDPKRTWEWIAPEDLEAGPEATVWTLGTITARQDAWMIDTLIPDPSVSAEIPRGRFQLLVLQCGIRGVRNFKDADGAEVGLEWQESGAGPIASDDFISRIPRDLRKALTSAILEGNAWNATDRKN